jgi:hypothetical protein
MEDFMQKECTVCKQEKPLEEFAKSKTGKFGHDAQCKKCRYQKTGKRYYLENKEKCHANASKWAKENRISINERVRKDYNVNPGKYLGRNKGNRENIQEQNRKYREKHREKINAQNVLRDHVKRGNIIKPSSCSICNSTHWIEAHHADYTKPLEVVWVCKKCHVAIHKRLENCVQPERPNSWDVKNDVCDGLNT